MVYHHANNWIYLHTLIHPAKSSSLLRERGPEVLYPGTVTPETWDRMTDYIIETYFKHPSYWLINGSPYFSVYDLSKLVRSFGTLESTARAIDRFEDKVINAGFKGLHMNAVVWRRTTSPDL
jgi:hypothetical protein